MLDIIKNEKERIFTDVIVGMIYMQKYKKLRKTYKKGLMHYEDYKIPTIMFIN